MEVRKKNAIGYRAAQWPLDTATATIIFIHGAGGTGNFWQAQVEGLAARVNTVAIDLPGHGRSDGNGHDKIEDYARAVVDFSCAIKAPRPILCGISLGGAISLQLLLDYPELFRAGILICTGSKLRVAPDIFATIAKGMASYVDMIGDLVTSKSTDPARIQRFKEDTARCRSEVLVKDFRACDRFDVMKRLGSITSPVLVISAADDQVTPPKYGDFLQKSIANASRVHIVDAAHIVPMEKPEEVNRAIIKFLDQTGL